MDNTTAHADAIPAHSAPPTGRIVEVRDADSNKILFTYDTATGTVRMVRRRVTYAVNFAHLVHFGRASNKSVFRVPPQYDNQEDGDGDVISSRFE